MISNLAIATLFCFVFYHQTQFCASVPVPVSWTLQDKNVCYGTKGDQFGEFEMSNTGVLIGLKLVHRSGNVFCNINNRPPSYWGCGKTKWLFTAVTDVKNRVIFPTSTRTSHVYPDFPGYHDKSKELNFINRCSSVYVHKGQLLRIWYTEDLYKITVQDNGGKHCVDVYAQIID